MKKVSLVSAILFSMIACAASAQEASASKNAAAVITEKAEVKLLNVCKVTFPNGFTDNANCRDRVVVITKAGAAQCVPKENLVEKDGKLVFLKDRKTADVVTPCRNGMSVSS